MIFNNFKNIFNHINSNITKRYFSKKNQEECNKCLKQDNKNINVLFVSHDNDKSGGAFLSMATGGMVLNYWILWV